MDNSTVILKNLLHLPRGNDVEKAEYIFDGCTMLLGTLSGGEVESILLTWFDNLSLDYYILHSDKFTKFVAFIWTVCHAINVEQAKKTWKKLFVFFNERQKLENIRVVLIWTVKFEFSIDPLTEIEWVCDREFSMQVSDPIIISNILLLFGNSYLVIYRKRRDFGR